MQGASFAPRRCCHSSLTVPCVSDTATVISGLQGTTGVAAGIIPGFTWGAPHGSGAGSQKKKKKKKKNDRRSVSALLSKPAQST